MPKHVFSDFNSLEHSQSKETFYIAMCIFSESSLVADFIQ